MIPPLVRAYLRRLDPEIVAARLEVLAVDAEYEILRRAARAAATDGKRRRAIMRWLAGLKTGTVADFDAFGEHYTIDEGREALARTARGSVAAAGAELAGERASQFEDAQRNGCMCRRKARK